MARPAGRRTVGRGKSELTAELRRRHDVGTVELDDLVSAVRAISDPATHPALHPAPTSATEPGGIVQALIGTARALEPAVAAVIATHLDHGPRAVVEGDSMLPSIVDRVPDPTRVRTVFLWAEQDQILDNLARRETPTPDQRARARVSYLFGQDLRARAGRRHVPALQARPWSTLADRVEAACVAVPPSSEVRPRPPTRRHP